MHPAEFETSSQFFSLFSFEFYILIFCLKMCKAPDLFLRLLIGSCAYVFYSCVQIVVSSRVYFLADWFVLLLLTVVVTQNSEPEIQFCDRPCLLDLCTVYFLIPSQPSGIKVCDSFSISPTVASSDHELTRKCCHGRTCCNSFASLWSLHPSSTTHTDTVRHPLGLTHCQESSCAAKSRSKYLDILDLF